MGTNEAEQNVLEYLMRTRGLDQVAASNLLHQHVHHNWFSSKDEPELKELVTAYRSALGRDGRQASRQESS